MRIDILQHTKSQYDVLPYLTEKFSDALQREGATCRMLQLDDPLLYHHLLTGGADYTLCFNGLVANSQGEFLSDQLDIPHIGYIVDSANHFADLSKSQGTIIASVDRNAADFFRGLQCRRVLFLPHGVEKELISEPSAEKTYQVTMFSSCIDYEELQKEWPARYSKGWIRVLDQAVEGALQQGDASYIDALTAAIDYHSRMGWVNPHEIDLIQALTDVEMVSRGKEKVALLNALEGIPVDLFGSGPWERYLKSGTVKVHGPLPYLKALEVMKQSCVVLNSCLWIKQGAHERLLAAVACGAVNVVNTNPYLREQFQHKQELLFYQCQRWQEVVPAICDVLENGGKRTEICARAAEVVRQKHTWDARARTLMDFLKRGHG